MDTYRPAYSPKFDKQMAKLSPEVSRYIMKWINKHLFDTPYPRSSGHGLKENLSGLWRYRVGDYRIIADIQEDKLIILCLKVSHRREVYR